MKYAITVIALAYVLAVAGDEDVTTNTPPPTPADWFECPGDGAYPNPYDCNKYFICISDNAWAFKCPAKLWFNPKKGYCDFKGNVDCEAKPTPSQYQTENTSEIPDTNLTVSD